MNIQSLEELRYPIGKYKRPETYSDTIITNWIEDIASLPSKLKVVVEPMTDEQLDTPYRPEGWTVRQLVHHIVDSHMNSYIRFKWTLTEDNPTIKAYNEAEWAKLPDTFQTPVSVSLALMEALHLRWMILLRALTAEDLEQAYVHPEPGYERSWALKEVIALYAWHSNHHLAHITNLVERKGW